MMRDMIRFRGIAALSVAALSLTTVGTAFAQPPRAAPWLTNYAAARDAARQSGRPIFLVFR